MSSDFGTTDINDLEKEVYASVQYKLDLRKVENTLRDDMDDQSSLSSRLYDDPTRSVIMTSQWKISLAAACVVSAFFAVLAKANLPVAAAVFVSVFLVANQDPLDEDNSTGAIARLLGRLTIQSVESSKPKLKAIARAAITDQEEIVLLKKRITQLEKENADLKLWRERRLLADDNLSKYNLEELKEMARQNQLSVGGTKSQLLMRLLENEILTA
jgi:hypothetical protein